MPRIKYEKGSDEAKAWGQRMRELRNQKRGAGNPIGSSSIKPMETHNGGLISTPAVGSRPRPKRGGVSVPVGVSIADLTK